MTVARTVALDVVIGRKERTFVLEVDRWTENTGGLRSSKWNF